MRVQETSHRIDVLYSLEAMMYDMPYPTEVTIWATTMMHIMDNLVHSHEPALLHTKALAFVNSSPEHSL